MHVVRLEARAIKDRGRLNLAVDAFLAQDRNRRPNPRSDVGRRDVLLGIKCERDLKSRIGARGAGRELLIRAPGSSRSRRICQEVSDQARLSSHQDSSKLKVSDTHTHAQRILAVKRGSADTIGIGGAAVGGE